MYCDPVWVESSWVCSQQDWIHIWQNGPKTCSLYPAEDSTGAAVVSTKYTQRTDMDSGLGSSFFDVLSPGKSGVKSDAKIFAVTLQDDIRKADTGFLKKCLMLRPVELKMHNWVLYMLMKTVQVLQYSKNGLSLIHI